MKSIIILIFLIFFSFTSCIFVRPNFSGFSSGYKKLEEKDKSLIKFIEYSKAIGDIEKQDSIIYAINGIQLNKSIKNYDNVLIYLWSPNCKGEICYAIAQIQEYCTANNITLFVIVEYYDMEKIKNQYTNYLENPLLSINTNYYKTNYCNKYVKLFLKDLLADNFYNKEDLYSRYFLFSNGKLVDVNFNLEIK